MILFDTNVIIDLLRPRDDPAGSWSRGVYEEHVGRQSLCCNLVVLAELVAGSADDVDMGALVRSFGIDIVDMPLDCAATSGLAFAEYRRRGGSRTSILTDFLIAGHAAAIDATFATRDRRLVSYFPDLTLLTPEI